MENKELQEKKAAKKPANPKVEPKKEVKPASKKTETNPVFSRIDSICEVLKRKVPATVDDLIKEADALYVKKTGKPANYNESKANVRKVIPTLRHFSIPTPEK